MEGGDLMRYLSERGKATSEISLSEEGVRPLFHQILSGVSFAHQIIDWNRVVYFYYPSLNISINDITQNLPIGAMMPESEAKRRIKSCFPSALILARHASWRRKSSTRH
jgi:serine/threonine protein kinase